MAVIRFSVDGTKYELDAMRLLNTEAIAVKKLTGLTIEGFYNGLEHGDPEAMTALVWIAKRRNGEQVEYARLEFDTFEVAQSLSSDEPEEDPTVDPLSDAGEPTSSGEPGS